MDATLVKSIDDEIERNDVIIKAAENWAGRYKKDRKTFQKLIKTEAKMQRRIRILFREYGKRAEEAIDWNAYYGLVNAKVSVQTIVKGDFLEGISSEFAKITLQDIALLTAIGAEAGENTYKIPLGIRSTDAIIQQLATDRVAFLVGKRVDKDGKLVDNPRAEYRITDKTREDILQAVQTSINLGEAKAQAIDRIGDVIDNPLRAEKIAQTESINAYSNGMLEFGKESGATGKEVDDVGAIDECKEYADEGIVPLDHVYGGEESGPAFHTGCRCGLRIVYANEYKPE
jgi:hypothetical protein